MSTHPSDGPRYCPLCDNHTWPNEHDECSGCSEGYEPEGTERRVTTLLHMFDTTGYAKCGNGHLLLTESAHLSGCPTCGDRSVRLPAARKSRLPGSPQHSFGGDAA